MLIKSNDRHSQIRQIQRKAKQKSKKSKSQSKAKVKAKQNRYKMADKSKCVASEYFQNQCSGHYNAKERDIMFKYRDHRGNRFDDTVEKVSLCSFHHEWLKTMETLEMRGETPEDAVGNDLLENFKNQNIYRIWNRRSKKFPSGEGTMYLLQGDYQDSVPLKGDENIWELKGVFCYDDVNTKKMFEIVPITEVNVMEWLTTQKIVYSYPSEVRRVWLSKETGVEVEEDEVSMVNGGCFCKRIENTQEYTNVARDFKMDSCPTEIKEFFWKKKENVEFLEFQDCLVFIIDEMYHFPMINFRELYENCGLSDKEIFKKVHLLKEALVVGNTETIKCLKQSVLTGSFDCSPSSEKSQFHVIMWVVYVATNHQLYWKYSFGEIPNFYEEEKRYKRFFKNLVDLFVQQGLVKPLLCLAISGERQRDVCHKQRDYHNVVNENVEVVKMIVPEFVDASSTTVYEYEDEYGDVSDDGEKKRIGVTAWGYWKWYDNRLFNIRAFGNCGGSMYETFEKNKEIGEFLKPAVVVPEPEQTDCDCVVRENCNCTLHPDWRI